MDKYKGIDKDTRKILKAVEEAGFVVHRAKSCHLMVYKDDVLITTFSATASDPRAFRNGLAPLKRAGFQWPPRR
ncbi:MULTISPECIES: hypothetical protein [Rhodococcus]|uniref:hypothetical protein n=1 Tax=Rhodococcus TaxID=1827 RepID=UPI0007D93AB7|nr:MULTISPECIES: hypothetical protein [Rhodococcus]QXU56324.1 hypothetical protein KXC42_24280 [Rhodococcus sp. LW-XY12]UTM39831.1 hypothetical protein MX572_23870 [Rhodococcus pyridinivorans]